MGNLAIEVKNISKRYRIGMEDERPDTLFGAVTNVLKAPARSFRALRNLSSFEDGEADDILWALRDVSFDVKHGEVVGLIGRNGAGKSTLLKVLSRITEPTSGHIDLHGRVASLLEVGTGFHPELTGRENVYLNGAILGMTTAEVESKFDEIVAFSEIEKFIDTPVKRYSSGMKVRLAFSVAAHLEPEILLVDEVLAVGDVAFQKKCLGKMDDVAGEGRTVIFVSHHMSMIQALCQRGVVMQNGRVVYDGSVNDAVGEYLRYVEAGADDPFGDNPERSGSGRIQFTGARIRDEDGEVTDRLIAGTDVTIEFDYANRDQLSQARIACTIFNNIGTGVTHFNTKVSGFELTPHEDTGRVQIRIPRLPLPPGRYRIAAALQDDGGAADLIPSILVFHVDSSVFIPTGKTPDPKYCAVMVEHDWQHEPGSSGRMGNASLATAAQA